MNINAAIIDQRLVGIQDEIREQAQAELNIQDANRLKSLAFVYLCVKTMLDLDVEEAFDCLTEGGGDFGVDAMHMTESVDGEFVVTLFQGKYKANLEGASNFEEKGINALVNAIRYIFDPNVELKEINDRLLLKVEAARSLIREGVIPRIRALACNNGLKWNQAGQEVIDRVDFGDQLTWEHVNHDVLIGVLQRVKSVNDILRLTGRAVVEDMNYSRVCIGRMLVTEIADLMKRHGERLLERNIRRYLGLQGNRVNENIRQTLHSENPTDFYFFNNGLTLVCDDFAYNAAQSSDFQVRVENLQIVNGGQTCMTIFKTLEVMASQGKPLPNDASVLVRIYKLPKDNEDIVLQITHATNSQNPVDLRDLRANDERQRRLQTDMGQLDYHYHRKRMDLRLKPTDITSGVAAEAVLSVWRRRPQQAKYLIREHFGKLYDIVFTNDLNGTQAILAVLVYRIAENRRRRPQPGDPLFVRYASCFLAMRMGVSLLRDLKLELSGLNHKTFDQAKRLLDTNGDHYFQKALQDIKQALECLYGNPDNISLQQLAATFRRGDLMSCL